MADYERFKENLIDQGIIDSDGTHHEFVSGKHGQKIDFDLIATGSELYNQWTTVAADFIDEAFPDKPLVIIGVANGTNRTARDTAPKLSERRFPYGVVGLESAKDKADSKKLYLPDSVRKFLKAKLPELVVVLEDVGTTGSNSVQVATEARSIITDGMSKHQLIDLADEILVPHVEVVTTWKRQPVLPRLDEAGIPYRAIIDEALPTYDPEDCVRNGFCSKGWDFTARD